MAPPTPAMDQLPWDLKNPCSLRWAASAQVAAQEWAALVQFETARSDRGLAGFDLFLTSTTN
jgi:hypothetical protein